MRGSIRAFAGLLITMGAVGGVDNATDSQLLTLLVFAALGLGIMASGTAAMNKNTA